jgi:hypothetical protein
MQVSKVQLRYPIQEMCKISKKTGSRSILKIPTFEYKVSTRSNSGPRNLEDSDSLSYRLATRYHAIVGE